MKKNSQLIDFWITELENTEDVIFDWGFKITEVFLEIHEKDPETRKNIVRKEVCKTADVALLKAKKIYLENENCNILLIENGINEALDSPCSETMLLNREKLINFDFKVGKNV